MKQRPEELSRVVNRGPRGYWHRLWIPDKKHPRGGRDEWTFLSKDPEEAVRLYHERELDPEPAARAGTVGTVADAWLERYVKTVRDTKGHALAAARVRIYLKPFLGELPARKITTDDLMDYRQRLQTLKSDHTGRKLTIQTIRHVLSDVRALVLWAEARGLVRRGLLPRRFLPRAPERPPRSLTAEQQEAVRAIEDPYGLGCRVMLESSARWSELCRLTRGDLVDGELVIHGMTKSRRMRSVPVPPALIAELSTHVGKIVPYEPKDVSWFNRAVRLRSGVETFSAHRCRHSFGFNYMASGGNLLVLKELMGHSVITLTAMYAKPTQDLVRQDAGKVHARRGG